MIKYTLCCGRGHNFEAWFASIAAFDKQALKHLVSCPECGSSEVEKQIMAPALLKGRQSARPISRQTGSGGGPDGALVAATAGPGTAPLVELLRAWKQHVMANSEDVGRGFADEARKIHHGEAEERSIRGETSNEDAARLTEEGIAFGILPVLPEEHN